MKVPIHQAKTHLSRLVERALAGEEVVITRGRTAAVRLVAVDRPAPRRRPGVLAVAVPDAFFAPLSGEDLAAWEGDP